MPAILSHASSIQIVGNNIEALTTAVVMASLDHTVYLYCNETEVDELLKHHAFEHQLIALWELYVAQKRVCVTTEAYHDDSSLYWLFLETSHLSNLSNEAIINILPAEAQIVLSGTCALGEIARFAAELPQTEVFYVPFVFLTDGASFVSMLNPHVFLIGEKTYNTYQNLSQVAPLIKRAGEFTVSNIKNTEFARSSIMAMLASRLSFMNEMSRLADAHAVNMTVVKRMMGLDSRIGNTYLNPSWGFGGHTLPHALELLQDDFKSQGIATSLIHAIDCINENQKELIFRKFWQHFDSYVSGKTVLIWGAGYKAGSGRTLNSAIHPLLNLLWHYDITTYVYDNNAQAELMQQYDADTCQMVSTAHEKLADVDALFIISWPDATPPDISILSQLALPVFDAQNLLSNEQIAQLNGFYTGIGRSKD